MALRSRQQKIGAVGHKWLAAHIEEHPDWLARELGEDYGVDLEAEVTENGVRGEILKIQIKSSTKVERNDKKVKLVIERKYLDYAESCRYPVIFVLVDTRVKQAWYLWLQDWLLRMRPTHGRLDPEQACWTQWIPEHQTVSAGLKVELKAIACWKGETQLTLSLIDALKAATAAHNKAMVEALTEVISTNAPDVADVSLDAMIDEALVLGQRLWGTVEGNIVANQLFSLARRFGDRISRATVCDLVLRDGSYSRTGLTALEILYDEFFEHLKSLQLPPFFVKVEPRVAFFCAFREAHPDHDSSYVFVDPTGFTFAGLQYCGPKDAWDKYANRGPSALLDYLVPVDGTVDVP